MEISSFWLIGEAILFLVVVLEAPKAVHFVVIGVDIGNSIVDSMCVDIRDAKYVRVHTSRL